MSKYSADRYALFGSTFAVRAFYISPCITDSIGVAMKAVIDEAKKQYPPDNIWITDQSNWRRFYVRRNGVDIASNQRIWEGD